MGETEERKNEERRQDGAWQRRKWEEKKGAAACPQSSVSQSALESVFAQTSCSGSGKMIQVLWSGEKSPQRPHSWFLSRTSRHSFKFLVRMGFAI